MKKSGVTTPSLTSFGDTCSLTSSISPHHKDLIHALRRQATARHAFFRQCVDKISWLHSVISFRVAWYVNSRFSLYKVMLPVVPCAAATKPNNMFTLSKPLELGGVHKSPRIFVRIHSSTYENVVSCGLGHVRSKANHCCTNWPPGHGRERELAPARTFRLEQDVNTSITAQKHHVHLLP
jgi:hypothetical protein